MGESFNLWDELASSESEGRLASQKNERKLMEVAYDVRQNFGRYLAKAETVEDYEERFSYLGSKIENIISDKVKPTQEVLSWLKEELSPKKENEKTSKTSGFVKRSEMSDWQWDNESRSFKSTKSSAFGCQCGSAVQGVGQHSCKCGKIWNISSITDSNKTASTPLFICREVLRRDTVLSSVKSVQSADVMDKLLQQRNKAQDNKDLPKALDLDNKLEDNGMHSDDRATCHQCQSWDNGDHDHRFGKRLKESDNLINPLDTTPPNPPQVTVPQGPDPSVLAPSTPDPSSIGTPEAMGGSNPLDIPSANTIPDTIQQTRNSKKADVVDPLHPHSNPVPQAEGYDVPELFGPAAGDEIHDENWKMKMKESQKTALGLIFSDFEDSEDNPVDETETEEAPTPPAPEPASPMTTPEVAPLAVPPVENQPLENQALDVAQQAILDMILREKREDVMGIQDTEQKQDLLEDAYQTLDTVQNIESAENMNTPLLAAARKEAFFEGYVTGYLDRLSENSYEDRKTDYVGTKPAIPGISNGLDDAIPATKAEDTTQQLRTELARELDQDNEGHKEQRPLDPAEPFGKNKTTATARR